MQSVLGIDAAWTVKQPSGVALVTGQADQWQLVVACDSYGQFLREADAELSVEPRPLGRIPDADSLLQAATQICGIAPAVVAIDMPMSRQPIVSRRVADNAVSREYGSRKCSTHSPSSERPGEISDHLRQQFDLAGYPLRTDSFVTPALIEVYPHPALMELMRAPERLPYKAAKMRAYWPGLRPPERRERLLEQWQAIMLILDQEISGIADMVSLPVASATGLELKGFEDMLDAIVCAWVGVQALKGTAVAFGDGSAAIWIPGKTPRCQA